jgi:ribosomal protein L40E
MKVCTDCGHENSDDAQFCESCRGYLWGERDAADEKQAVLAGQAAIDSTVDEQPAAVPPEREFEPPPPERPDFHEPHPGELICDQCGIGNRAEANFCRRCGSTLVGADIATRAPWWRRLRAQRRRTYSAGERRRRRQPVASTATQKARRGMFQMSRALGIIALLGIVSIGAWRGDLAGRMGHAFGSAKGTLFPRYASVIPTDVGATSHRPGHEAAAAFDKNLSTFWAENAPGDGRRQKLTARFHRIVHLARVGFTLGDQTKPQNFVSQPVPRNVRLTYFDRYGRRLGAKVVHLAHEPKFQRFSIDAKNVTRVDVVILSVFHSRSGHAAAVTEVEFFEKS